MTQITIKTKNTEKETTIEDKTTGMITENLTTEEEMIGETTTIIGAMEAATRTEEIIREKIMIQITRVEGTMDTRGIMDIKEINEMEEAQIGAAMEVARIGEELEEEEAIGKAVEEARTGEAKGEIVEKTKVGEMVEEVKIGEMEAIEEAATKIGAVE